MTSKKSHNPYSNEELKAGKPVEKKGEHLKEGEPFMEEELEKEEQELKEDIENMEALEDEVLPSENRLVRELRGEIDKLKSDLQESRDKLLRAHAEIENVRRRAIHDVEKAHKYGLEKFVDELIPVVDSLEHALADANKSNVEKITIEGIELTLKKFLDTLEKFGVKQINPLGVSFNPQLHEAVTVIKKPDVEPNIVVEVFQKGYEINSRLVRPARVIVAN